MRQIDLPETELSSVAGMPSCSFLTKFNCHMKEKNQCRKEECAPLDCSIVLKEIDSCVWMRQIDLPETEQISVAGMPSCSFQRLRHGNPTKQTSICIKIQPRCFHIGSHSQIQGARWVTNTFFNNAAFRGNQKISDLHTCAVKLHSFALHCSWHQRRRFQRSF